MKIEVKKLEGSKRELNIEVAGDIVANKFEDVFKDIGKEAKVPGFRPGNAPRDILEKHYASAAHEQVLKDLVPDIYNQAIDKEGLDVIELPEIFDVKLDRGNLSFKAKVQVSPEIALKEYRGVKIEYHKISVAAEEIKRNIDKLKESRKIDSVDDAFARSVGYPNFLELEKAIERQLFMHKEEHERQRIENDLIEAVMKGLDFEVPKSLVSRQLEDMVRQAKVDLALKGLGREKIDEQEAGLRKEMEEEASRQVKVYLVLAQIAKKENITADNNMPRRVMELLLREANWSVKE